MMRLTSASPTRLWQRLPAGEAASGPRQPSVRVRGGWISEIEDGQRPHRGEALRMDSRPGARAPSAAAAPPVMTAG